MLMDEKLINKGGLFKYSVKNSELLV